MADLKPALCIFKDTKQLSRAAADMFVALAKQAIGERGRFYLSSGKSLTEKQTQIIIRLRR